MAARLFPERTSDDHKKLGEEYAAGVSLETLRVCYAPTMTLEAFKKACLYAGFRRLSRVPVSQHPVFASPELDVDRVLVICDAQIPYHDADFLNRLLEVAEAWGVRAGISGGDMLNLTSFSSFGENPEEKVWKREREEALEVIEGMTAVIPTWYLVLGNHCARLLKLAAEQLGHNDLYRLIGAPDGIVPLDYYHCVVNGEWRISHPRNASVIHGRVATRLATKYRQHICAGHGHLAGVGFSESGDHLAIDVGVVCDPKRLDYVQVRDNIRPIMNQGALFLVREGDITYPEPVWPGYTNWAALRRKWAVTEPAAALMLSI